MLSSVHLLIHPNNSTWINYCWSLSGNSFNPRLQVGFACVCSFNGKNSYTYDRRRTYHATVIRRPHICCSRILFFVNDVQFLNGHFLFCILKGLLKNCIIPYVEFIQLTLYDTNYFFHQF